MWYNVVLIVLASLFGVLCVVSIFAGSKLLDHITVRKGRTIDEARAVQREWEKWDFNDYDNNWDKEEFDIITEDNVKLYGVVITNPNATQHNGRDKVVIISHGHICNHIQSVKYADIFYNLGYHVVMYDQRFFGNSEGYNSTLGYKETGDLSKVIQLTKERFGKECYLALHGESMGGACVLNVLATNAQDIEYVIADCPFSSSGQLYRELLLRHFVVFPTIISVALLAKIKYDYNIFMTRPIDVVGKVDVPICYIHGTADDLIPIHHSRQLYKATKNKDSRLVEVQDALHARSHMLSKTQYIKIINDYVDYIEKGGNNNDESQPNAI